MLKCWSKKSDESQAISYRKTWADTHTLNVSRPLNLKKSCEFFYSRHPTRRKMTERVGCCIMELINPDERTRDLAHAGRTDQEKLRPRATNTADSPQCLVKK